MTKWGPIREILWERSGGLCEVSGVALDPDTFDVHHRRNKGMGGTSRPDVDTLPNLLALDPLVHNLHPQSVHMRRNWSEQRGYLLPKHIPSPGMWPVWVRGRFWALLTTEGHYYLPPGL